MKEREKVYKAPKGGFTAPPGVIHYSAKKTRILGRLLDKPNNKLTQGWKKFLLHLVILCYNCVASYVKNVLDENYMKHIEEVPRRVGQTSGCMRVILNLNCYLNMCPFIKGCTATSVLMCVQCCNQTLYSTCVLLYSTT